MFRCSTLFGTSKGDWCGCVYLILIPQVACTDQTRFSVAPKPGFYLPTTGEGPLGIFIPGTFHPQMVCPQNFHPLDTLGHFILGEIHLQSVNTWTFVPVTIFLGFGW